MDTLAEDGDLMFNSRTGEFVNVIRNGYSNIMTDFNGEVYNVQYRKWGIENEWTWIIIIWQIGNYQIHSK